MSINRVFFSVVLGLSGGIDSALVAALATAALGAENVHCLLMPSAFSTPHSLSDARTCAEKLGCPATVLAIEDSFQTLLQALQPLFADTPFGLAEENIHARLRGLLVMAISNKHGHLALATGNKPSLLLAIRPFTAICVGLWRRSAISRKVKFMLWRSTLTSALALT
jgi:NAD+ synthase (glutamine-hydrolysing)